MNSTPLPYKPLPGIGRKLHCFHRLWLGPDHVLDVEGTGFSERYKRYYFRDIQAFVWRKTNQGTVSNILTGLLAVALLGVGFAIGEEGTYIFGLLSAVVLVWLLVNLFRGPTCSFQVLTEVQAVTLPSINRLSRARKILAILEPLILAAQKTEVPAEGNSPSQSAPPAEAGESNSTVSLS